MVCRRRGKFEHWLLVSITLVTCNLIDKVNDRRRRGHVSRVSTITHRKHPQKSRLKMSKITKSNLPQRLHWWMTSRAWSLRWPCTCPVYQTPVQCVIKWYHVTPCPTESRMWYPPASDTVWVNNRKLSTQDSSGTNAEWVLVTSL